MGATITVGGLALFAEGMRNPLIHSERRVMPYGNLRYCTCNPELRSNLLQGRIFTWQRHRKKRKKITAQSSQN